MNTIFPPEECLVMKDCDAKCLYPLIAFDRSRLHGVRETARTGKECRLNGSPGRPRDRKYCGAREIGGNCDIVRKKQSTNRLRDQFRDIMELRKK